MSRIDHNGTVYQLTGPTDAPVMVLVHGLGLNRLLWKWHVPALARHYRVLTFDLFGHGESAAAPSEPSLTLFSTQLRALLDELGIQKCTVVGFSLGGMINRRFALDYPRRVQALVILNSPHRRSPEAQRRVEKRAMQTANEGLTATLERTLARWFTPDFRATHRDTVRLVCHWMTANNPEIIAKCRNVLATGVGELVRPSGTLDQPALVMTCEHDRGSTPQMAYAIAAEIPGATTLVLPRLQHMGLVEQPHRFTQPIIEFLNRIHQIDDTLLSNTRAGRN